MIKWQPDLLMMARIVNTLKNDLNSKTGLSAVYYNCPITICCICHSVKAGSFYYCEYYIKLLPPEWSIYSGTSKSSKLEIRYHPLFSTNKCSPGVGDIVCYLHLPVK